MDRHISSRYKQKRGEKVSLNFENPDVDKSSPFRHEHSGKISKMSVKMMYRINQKLRRDEVETADTDQLFSSNMNFRSSKYSQPAHML